MQVSKWGNSLAVRLPAGVVDALELEEGDQIEIRVAQGRVFEVSRDQSRNARWLACANFGALCLQASCSIAADANARGVFSTRTS